MTRHLLHFCALTLLALFSAAFDESDLLPVDEAFALDARAGDPGSARFDFTIAEGYYLYRHRFSVQALDDSGAAGALEVPRGTPHHDEFFGDVETWRSAVSATLSGLDGGAQRFRVKYQGCADAGICYPPQSREVMVQVAAALPGAGGFSGLPGAAGS